MNRIHHWYCSSNRWRRMLEREVFPRVFDGIDLGNDVLEIGPGPGLTTDLLRTKCERLTCLEIDPVFAAPLRERMRSTNVTVLEGDATQMNFEDGRFSGVVSLTMLHHVPSPQLQDELFAEVRRVTPARWSLYRYGRAEHLGTSAYSLGRHVGSDRPCRSRTASPSRRFFQCFSRNRKTCVPFSRRTSGLRVSASQIT